MGENDSNWVRNIPKKGQSSPEIMRIRIILIIQKSAHKFSGVPKIRISAEPGHPAISISFSLDNRFSDLYELKRG